MPVYFAAMPGLWSVLLVVFIVIPAVKWSIRGAGYGTRIGRRRGRDWVEDWDDGRSGGSRVGRREFDALRQDLDGRLGEIDQLHARVAELENRLDFTERLLASRETVALTAPKSQ